MAYYTEYESGLIGKLTLASDGETLIGCWFDNDRFFGYGVNETLERKDDLPFFDVVREWLDRYFAGEKPRPQELPLNAHGSEFQKRVWDKLAQIPYGTTVTYGDIAHHLEADSGKRASAQAVGGAVGHNPLCVIVPCHRVMGANGNLTGFGGGIDTKVALLEHEKISTAAMKRPKSGGALEGTPNAARQGRGAEYAFEDLSDDDMYAVLEARDDSFIGVFFVGVKSTKIYCRPGCCAKMPLRKNCVFFPTAAAAEAAGFRACKRCKPQLV